MSVVGIIAEYNPLHNGHIYHIEQAKKLADTEDVIISMSGNFVQRGEPAVADKYTRAEWAIRSGASFVMELPTVYAISSAERFALGAVRQLASTGIVTHLAFGCEDDDFDVLNQAAEMLSNETPAFKNELHAQLKTGKSYPKARYDALKNTGTPEPFLEIIKKPNNVLAIEYLRALKLYAPDIIPVPIKRNGNSYDEEELTGPISSSTSIRQALETHNESVLETMPFFVGGSMYYDESYPVTMTNFEQMILYRMKTMSRTDISALPDITESEGYANLLYSAAKNADSLQDLLDKIKTKRYTLARCKRILLAALLHITAADIYNTVQSPDSEYIHPLAISKTKQSLLSSIRKYSSCPEIIRNSDIEFCNNGIKRNLYLDNLSTDVYSIASQNTVHHDYQGVVFI